MRAEKTFTALVYATCEKSARLAVKVQFFRDTVTLNDTITLYKTDLVRVGFLVVSPKAQFRYDRRPSDIAVISVKTGTNRMDIVYVQIGAHVWYDNHPYWKPILETNLNAKLDQ